MSMRSQRMNIIALLIAGPAAWSGAWAQSQRDPTLPPAALTQQGGSTGQARGRTEAPAKSMSIMVVDGQPHLMVGSRLYAQGQKLGGGQIERITETQVWLRQGRALRKLPVFSGIERNAVEPADAASACPDAQRGSDTASPSSASGAVCDRRPL